MHQTGIGNKCRMIGFFRKNKHNTMNLITQLFCLVFFFSFLIKIEAQPVEIWHKKVLEFKSEVSYENPLYAVNDFYAVFTSPTGRKVYGDGFWDGGDSWKINFKPDETGVWTYATICTDEKNKGLNGQPGQFTVVENTSSLKIYKSGGITHNEGTYHLRHADGTPFFWLACTAWNGALSSTDEEWDRYLNHRVENNYNTIQFVTTQWRGGPADSEGEKAFTNPDGPVVINTEFFKRLDKKVDRINEYGLVAAPVLLWTLPFGDGRHLSPGYSLPPDDAMRLGKYIKARYSGNIVVWILGGDGKFYDEMESKWKYLGREIFKHKNDLATLHPHGRSWVGTLYDEEEWYDLVGYQSSHSKAKGTVDWINKGPVSKEWNKISPRPIINMEPCYEEIRFVITAKDVRNASYWSLFAAPVSGVTYGANGIWPWIREGELIINHNDKGGVSDWETSMKFPGSIQMGYLYDFFGQYDWWDLLPSNELLVEQPGDEQFDQFISVISSLDKKTVLVYTPVAQEIKLRCAEKPNAARWFDPVTNKYQDAWLKFSEGILSGTSPFKEDALLEVITK